MLNPGLKDTIAGTIPVSLPIGQTTMTGSTPVVIASNQSSIPVSGTLDTITTLPLPTGASTEATLALIKAKTDNIDVALSTRAVTGLTNTELRATAVPVSGTVAVTGVATETTLGTRLSESDFDTKTGSLTETAPATDTASSGLNGRLQRIAQRISSLITALGSPFQAGGSIGNTTFAATQAIGTNLHTVVDSGNVTTVGTITNTVPTLEVAPTTIVNNKTTVTTAGTRVQFATNTCKSIVIKALAANAGTIYVGNSTVASTNGFQLAAGDVVALDISNTNVVYIDSSVNGEGTSWLAIN